jgi:hypothetical protein
MGTVARLKNNGNIMMKGQINERIPPVTKGLVSYFPFDYTDVGVNFRNMLNLSDWIVGTNGSQRSFSQNGSTDENQVIMFPNPWGIEEKTWATLSNDSTSNSDGGWNVSNIPIDNTKKYRLSVWIRRENVGDGRTYFGCQANTVCSLGSTTPNGNPYFTSRLIGDVPDMNNGWVLWIAHIHPHDYTGGTDSKSGIYSMDGRKVSSVSDFKWTPETKVGGHRTYLYYSTSTLERQYWCRPRFEISDGYESTVEDMLLGLDEKHYAENSQNISFNPVGISVENGVQNLLSNSDMNTYTTRAEWIGNYGSPNYEIVQESIIEGTKSQRIYYGNTGNTGTMMNKGFYLDVSGTGGEVYTFTFYGKGWEDISGISYYSTQVSTIKNEKTKLLNGWTLYRFTFSLNSTACRIYIRPNGNTLYDFDCLVNAPMLQKNSYSNTYTVDNRASGKLIAKCQTSNSFTLFYKFTPSAHWASIMKTSYSKRMMNLYDTNTGKKLWLSDYHGGGDRTTSAPWIGCDEFVSSGYNGWHWHFGNRTLLENKEYWFAFVKNGANWTKYMMSEEGLDASSVTHTNQELIDLKLDKVEFVGDYSCSIRNLSMFDRALSADEIMKLGNNTFSVNPNGDIITEYISQNDEGWELVYHGLATYAQSSDPQAFVNRGNNIEFNEIKITCPFWGYETSSTTTATAVLSQPFSWYVKWLDEQDDSISPKVKFHGVNGVQDVGLTRTTSMLYGYGNSWRQITPVHNVADRDYLYTGSVPSFVNKHDWYNTTDYKRQMDTDNWRETGMYSLTPKEYQTIQVWVRLNKSTSSTKMKAKKGNLVVNEVLEGIKNIT